MIFYYKYSFLKKKRLGVLVVSKGLHEENRILNSIVVIKLELICCSDHLPIRVQTSMLLVFSADFE
jgi:hypothetical protein